MKITRNLIREYYGIPQGESAAYHYMNAGFVKCSEKGNPKVDKTAFVGDVNATCSITGYENAWDFETQYLKGDPVVDDLAAIARGQRTGDASERLLVSVDMADPVAGLDNTYTARRAKIAVEVNPPAGDPKSITTLSGTLHQSGDLVGGVFNIASRTFTQS
ncbi:MAG: hypothetical protein VB104_04885 [Candidatus Limiplasma sp.]|nr:hypothetical protein [Candidatus Limiplasma sp.]